MSTFEDLVLYKDRIVIPKSLRSQVLKILHSAHQGCTGMIARANNSVYWPGIRKDVMSCQSNCRSCLEISPSQAREPLDSSELPERPFQVVCADICEIN
ncbi:MAG: integrase zinc binding domain-containing protein, partial [Bacteroidota bacterium]